MAQNNFPLSPEDRLLCNREPEKCLSDGFDLRPISDPKVFVYMSWYKQKIRILFFRKPVYHFATRCTSNTI